MPVTGLSNVQLGRNVAFLHHPCRFNPVSNPPPKIRTVLSDLLRIRSVVRHGYVQGANAIRSVFLGVRGGVYTRG